ncbi:MAG: glycosyltransferase family 2 protein [Ilumatobacteraceae bacterium]|nr:glycosyltransferase family 2 protein [Ilumatobacteraceae bacterium]
MSTARGPSLAIQVVLFDNEADEQLRLAHALAASIRRARDVGTLGDASVRYGDCSPQQCLSSADIEALGDALRAATSDVTHEFFDANLGSAGGSNRLASRSDSDLIWVLNPDTYPAPTALQQLLQVIRDDHVGIAEARQVPIEHPKAYDPITGDTSWACGFSLLMRRAVFEEVGGFDDHFFPLYGDDVDLSWRVRAAGYTVRYVPSAVVVHDKPIATEGAVRWTPGAARSSHLARLWLYRKYGRRDLEDAFLGAVDGGADPVAADAVAEFKQRVLAGDVPEPVGGAAGVADFVGRHYGPHRFEYQG